ncbi:MAG TPA: ABC transporter ATP-binding protein [Jatrophihabitantaceae bacterium]|jgi:ABC-2 type transport system ATP-binding protein
MSAITAEGLTKRYGDLLAVDDVSFDVPAGQLVAVLGPNGAGKTTTMEMLEGFTRPTHGTVRVLGCDPLRGGRAWRGRVGLVLQSTSLEREPTVRDLLTLFARLYPEPRPVAEVLELMDLGPEAVARIGTLSGGQQRRVDIALAIVGRPEVLFLDEPTTGLDPEARRRCWAAVESLTAAGTTIVLTTHYLDEADRLAHRVVILSAGRIVADAPPAQLRAGSGLSTIHYPLPRPELVADLPFGLAQQLGPDGAIHLRTDDPAPILRELASWAERHELDLSALQVNPPSLEDAYLAVAGSPALTGLGRPDPEPQHV